MGNFGSELSSQSQVIRKAIKKAFDEWCGAVAAALEEAKERKEIAPHHNTAILARFLINSWEGAVMRSKVAQSDSPFKDFFTVTFNSILKR